MSFLSLSPLQVLLLVLATAAIVVFLYWLKPPPQRVLVPSTLIWSRVLKERRRRSDFWRWLISLLIALATALAVAFAIGKPEVEALSGRARRIAIVLDSSPTMATTTASGPSRWDLAVAKATELLGQGSPASEYLVMDTAGQLVATGYTSRRRAEEQLSNLRPSTKDTVGFPSSDPLLSQGSGAEVYFIGDGVLVRNVPEHVVTISVFEPADNVGITAFDLRPIPAEPTRYEGFLELSNPSAESKRVVLQLDGTGGESVQRAVNLAPGQVLGESLELDNFISGPIRVLIDAPDDSLAIDNVAYAYVASPRRVRVTLVTVGNAYLETLLPLDPRIALEVIPPPAYEAPTADNAPDLYVFDRFAPQQAPGVPALLFRPSAAEWLPAATGQELNDVSLAGVESDHPLLQYVSLEDVVVETARHVASEDREIVVGSAEQPILVVAEVPVRWAQWTFDLADSNLPLQVGFPIFLSNAVTWLTGVDVLPSHLGTITVPMSATTITDVRGESVPSRSIGGRTAFTPQEPGLYSVRGSSGDLVVSANLLSPSVSAVNDSAFAGQEAETSLADYLTGSVGSTELFAILILIALVFLLVEWWTYHRRMTV